MAISLRNGRALEEPKTSNVKGVQVVIEKEAHMDETKYEKKIRRRCEALVHIMSR